ncbi:1-deoxy-D-xylulose-5-phosphate reductoisomerase [Metabacillus idriensis]|uniref:1-deoxy-D-xylulose 5-phosphate reductoisomerase n=1 Tax=Metabacillus idriensis TaxID=324768 RepID=A0A6I2M8R8_9BACI|nr:1-deoxy-D-xylulose-5-phosphate reductoisomerase [Metabacillus idriensis]MCM3594267.1 1-deoxy-D-xylulose-5-phosphate reductoisomerase [Metabacillus idriensis]MRX53702.1 1-deoxy-D-xylulose-5-phosphate reductoisomerase [Metabacillus idriensis]OHR64893.1 1-deoxy-D-xylulose-5-phosphate reductoisomerase [Bacillus sp. HMSC76G11]
MKKISLLGATGSIGQQTLDVIKCHPDQFQLVAMSFGSNLELGRKAISNFSPSLVAVNDFNAYSQLKEEFQNITFTYGAEGLIEAAVISEAEIVVNAVVGSVGLLPTLKAIECKKTIALANKETLVTAGHLVTEHARIYGVDLLPVDSEHSAIFQCLQGENPKSLERLIVTASGGSFRDRKREELADVTVDEALNHPNWSMGAKITIDSATMMNKGLEVIEAHWLFDLPYEKIEVLLHKESIIHSMAEFHDRSVIAQLGSPDMRVPIQYALSYPERLPLSSTKQLNLWEVGKLHFEKADFERYRCLQFAYDSGKIGGTMPTVLNAANEEAVGAFLKGQIAFLQIEDLIDKALTKHSVISSPDLHIIQEVDKETRQFVQTLYS